MRPAGAPAAPPSRRPFRYVAIGDSIARGFLLRRPRPGGGDACRLRQLGVPLWWFDRLDDAYPSRLAGLLAGHVPAEVALDRRLTCSGAGTRTWWPATDRPAALVAHVMRDGADLITVTAGANDLLRRWIAFVPPCIALDRAGPAAPGRRRLLATLAPAARAVRAEAAGIERRLSGLLAWLRERTAAPICVTTYAGRDEQSVVAGRFLTPLNDAIRAAAGAAPDLTLVDLATALAPHANADAEPLIDPVDGMHPTAAGQRAIAAAILGALTATGTLTERAAVAPGLTY